jgi:hypothetical protein
MFTASVIEGHLSDCDQYEGNADKPVFNPDDPENVDVLDDDELA